MNSKSRTYWSGYISNLSVGIGGGGAIGIMLAFMQGGNPDLLVATLLIGLWLVFMVFLSFCGHRVLTGKWHSTNVP